MKKKIVAMAIIAACLAITGYSTYAYFTDGAVAHNAITSGGVDVVIEEWKEAPTDTKPGEPFKNINGIIPGAKASKIVTVKNIEEESWIRARFDVVITDANGDRMNLSPEPLASIITIDGKGEHWVQKENEKTWWYYNKPVATGVSTEPLFTEVVFDGPNMTNKYQNCEVKINVYAQAVQTANNGNSALEAAGWAANE